MSIHVICPGCRKSFSVDDKFAGKRGNCPKCKHAITVPAADVQIHGAVEFGDGGRTQTGQLSTKPVSRTEVKVTPVAVAATVAVALGVLLLTWLAGGLFRNSVIVCGLGLLLVSPPLVFAAYTFLRNDDLEPYTGNELFIRLGICTAAYIVLWGVFAYLGNQGILTGEPWTWIYIAPPLVIVGAIAALGSFDLEFGNATLHFAFYALVTFVLRLAAGISWPWAS